MQRFSTSMPKTNLLWAKKQLSAFRRLTQWKLIQGVLVTFLWTFDLDRFFIPPWRSADWYEADLPCTLNIVDFFFKYCYDKVNARTLLLWRHLLLPPYVCVWKKFSSFSGTCWKVRCLLQILITKLLGVPVRFQILLIWCTAFLIEPCFFVVVRWQTACPYGYCCLRVCVGTQIVCVVGGLKNSCRVGKYYFWWLAG